MQKEKGQRQLKVSSDIQRAFSEIFSEQDLFSEKKGIFINVLGVDISPDLKNAKITLDIFGLSFEQKKNVLKQLNDALPHFRNEMSKKVKLKYIPTIKFFIDEGLDTGTKINKIIDKESRNF